MTNTESGSLHQRSKGGKNLAASSDAESKEMSTPLTKADQSKEEKVSEFTWHRDLNNMIVLVLLYSLQGIPLGLVMGSVPFLLQAALSSQSSTATATAAAAAEAVLNATAGATTNSSTSSGSSSGSGTYALLGVFALAGYPYSLKLLWSPLVDTFYFKRFGRRKSWIVPVQILIGLYLITSSYHVEGWLQRGQVHWMTGVFFMLIVLVATQDIAVDGWAVTMLSDENSSYASTCQSVGLNIGFFLSYTIFLGLNSAEFCNRWLRSADQHQPVGLLSLSAYMHVWGVIYWVVTAGIALGKYEAMEPHDVLTSDSSASSSSSSASNCLSPSSSHHQHHLEHANQPSDLAAPSLFVSNVVAHTESMSELMEEKEEQEKQQQPKQSQKMNDESEKSAASSASSSSTNALSVWDVYKQIWSLLKLPNMRLLILVLLTVRVGFAASDNVAVLKMIERGLPREHLGMFALISFPFELVLPVIIGKMMQGTQPMRLYLKAFPLRLLLSAGAAVIVWTMPTPSSSATSSSSSSSTAASAGLSTAYYVVIIAYQLCYEFASNMMFVSLCGYFVRISDPKIGSTYMTLLNTLANLGGTWPKSVALALVDWCTLSEQICSAEGVCAKVVTLDGFYVLSGACFLIGVIYYLMLLRPVVAKLEQTPDSEWKCPK